MAIQTIRLHEGVILCALADVTESTVARVVSGVGVDEAGAIRALRRLRGLGYVSVRHLAIVGDRRGNVAAYRITRSGRVALSAFLDEMKSRSALLRDTRRTAAGTV